MNAGELLGADGEIVRTPAEIRELAIWRRGQGDTLPAAKIDVWIAVGLRLRYRVVSIGHTYGEWDSLGDATRFLNLLVDGNPDLEVLR